MDMVIEEKENDTNSLKHNRQHIDGPEYSIYNYFRTNAGLAIAVISGEVAVTSCMFRYASTLYNYEYLRFWGIDIAYAKQDDIGVIYTAFGVFFYYSCMMLSQFLLGSTATVYNHYNRFYLASKMLRRKQKKQMIINKRIKKRINKQIKKETNNSQKAKLQERINKTDKRIEKLGLPVEDKETIYKLRVRLVSMSILSIIVAILLCALGSWFFSLNYEEGTKTIMILVLTFAPGLFSILLYSLKKRPKVDVPYVLGTELAQYKLEVKSDKIVLFPIESWIQNGIKGFLSNSMIGTTVLQYLITVVACIVVLVSSGGRNAEQLRDFKVWTDSTSTYAIIYDNGTQIILEPIRIEGTHATIDTLSQRIVQPDDLSYKIYTFDNITILRSAENQRAPQDSTVDSQYTAS